MPGSWEVGSSGPRPCNSSRSPPLALAIFGRCALWCDVVARAAATDCCSCNATMSAVGAASAAKRHHLQWAAR